MFQSVSNVFYKWYGKETYSHIIPYMLNNPWHCFYTLSHQNVEKNPTENLITKQTDLSLAEWVVSASEGKSIMWDCYLLFGSLHIIEVTQCSMDATNSEHIQKLTLSRLSFQACLWPLFILQWNNLHQAILWDFSLMFQWGRSTCVFVLFWIRSECSVWKWQYTERRVCGKTACRLVVCWLGWQLRAAQRKEDLGVLHYAWFMEMTQASACTLQTRLRKCWNYRVRLLQAPALNITSLTLVHFT